MAPIFARECLMVFTPWHLDAVSGSHPPHLLRVTTGHLHPARVWSAHSPKADTASVTALFPISDKRERSAASVTYSGLAAGGLRGAAPYRDGRSAHERQLRCPPD